MNMIASAAIDRRAVALAGLSLLVGAAPASAKSDTLTVYKSPTCGCCRGWVSHMTRAGFQSKVIDTDDLVAVRRRLGVPDALASCHTASIGGYFVEGHVPPADVRRLLRERPKARGIAVPGMPLGSPGMETPTGDAQAFQTMLLTDAGTKVYARH